MKSVVSVLMLAGCGGCESIFPLSLSQNSQVLDRIDESVFEAGILPENFVSVGLQIPDYGYYHLTGGFLIHPGVVLTSWKDSEDYYFYEELGILNRQFRLTKEVYKKGELYVAFDLQKKGEAQRHKIKIRRIKEHPSRSEGSPNFDTIQLLFFEPTEEIAHIKPLPLVTTKDLRSMDEVVGQDLWGVGVVGYADEKPPDYSSREKTAVCPHEEHTKLGRMNFPITREQHDLMSEVIKVFPGRIRPYIFYGGINHVFLHAVQHTADFKNFENCSRLGFFCTYPTESFHLPTDVRFQCTEHLGYPVLWKTPSGIWKVLAATAATPFDDMRRSQDTHNHGELIWPQPPRSTHFNLIFAQDWIKYAVESYAAKSSPYPFEVNADVWESWDDFIERSLHKDKALDFVVSLALLKPDSDDEYIHNCRGFLIMREVVLTAGHCAEKMHKNPDLDMFVVFRIGDQEYRVAVEKIILHPTYLEGLPEDVEAGTDGKDLALLFYKHSKELPEVHPASLVLDEAEEQEKIREILKNKAELWSLASHYRIHHEKKQFRLYYRVRLHMIRDLSDLTQKMIRLLFSHKDRKEIILSEMYQLSLEPVEEANLAAKLYAFWMNEKEDYGFVRSCDSHPWSCSRAHESAYQLEKYAVACKGDSGGPVMWRNDSGKLQVLGVLAKAASTSLFPRCLSMQKYERIAPQANWIRSVLKQEGYVGLLKNSTL